MSKVKVQTAGTAGPIKRVESGVPAGGQFDHQKKTPGTTVLDAHPEAGESEAPKKSVEDMTEMLGKYATGEALVALASKSAAYWQRHYNQRGKSTTVGVDDIAQETILRVLQAVDKGIEFTSFQQMVSSTAANVTVRATENVFRAEDRKAYRIFDAERTAREHKLKRSLTQVEEDEIAQDVLDNWEKPRHRPSKDFRTARTSDISIYGAPENEGADIASTLVAPEDNGTYIEPGSFMDKAHTALETKGAAHKAEARRLAWNAFAESVDVPLARAGSLSQRQVTKHRSLIANYKKDDAFADNTDILAACEDWANGTDNEATEALFAPFGDLDNDGQEKIVSMLERFGAERALTMWQGALGYANNKHSEEAAAA